MRNKLFIRGLRKANNTKFSVDKDGSKKYYDKEFNTYLAYASGQQIKRNFIEYIVNESGGEMSSIDFLWKKEGKEDIVRTSANPNDVDQLLGGFMRTDINVKRTGPFSISSFRPLHPLLCSLNQDQGTFDRRNNRNANIIIVDGDNELGKLEDVMDMLDSTKINKFKASKFLNPEVLVNGLYLYDIEIDLDRLFSVNLIRFNPEVNEQKISELLASGWVYNDNKTKLVMAKEKRDALIPYIAEACLYWSFNSNKSRTYDPLNTFATVITDKAYELSAMGGELIDDNDKQKAKLFLDNSNNNLYTSREVKAHLSDYNYSDETNINKAKELIIKKLTDYDYEK